MTKIILASASPRRRALLEQAGIPFEVIVSDVDETMDAYVPPHVLVESLAMRKAEHVLPDVDGSAVIIAADTIVYHRGRALGKPAGEEDAFHMLKGLQGQTHTVYTGVALINKQDYAWQSFVDHTRVDMRELSDDEIRAYLQTGEPFDKAGAYAIQGKGSLLIERVEGDYYTVVGLPLVKIGLALQKWGIHSFM